MMKKLKLLTILLLVWCTLLTGCSSQNKRNSTTVSEEIGDYIYNKPIEVDPTHIFKLKVGDEFDRSYKYSELNENFQIYTNPSFTMYIEPMIEYDYNNTLQISPPVHRPVLVPSIDFDKIETEYIDLFKDGEWGNIYSTYYLVQRVDLKTYETLEKPIVTPFQIKKNTQAVETRYKMTENGILHLSWEPVAGAQRYFVISVKATSNDVRDTLSWQNDVFVLSQTTSTEWLSDRSLDHSLHFNNMNIGMEQYSVSDDEHQIEDDSEYAELNAMTYQSDYYLEYGVIADLGGKFTPYSPISGSEIAESMPMEVAKKAAEEMGFGQQAIQIDELPAQFPVTVASGKTKLFTLKYDIDTAVIAEGEGSIEYTVNGTVFGGIIHFSDLKGTQEEFDALKAKVNSIYNEIQMPTGGELTYTYMEDPPELKIFTQKLENQTTTSQTTSSQAAANQTNVDVTTAKQKVSGETIAEEPLYPINGSTEFVKFLATNMIQRNEWIDYSRFSKSEIPRDIWDAVLEAEYQNPMILWVSAYYNYPSEKVLYVEYESDATWNDKQNEILAKANEILSLIITSGMTDQEKAIAINDYLIENGEYDYEALENKDLYGRENMNSYYYDAWTPYGLLIKNIGVCASYSDAFKLLADLAGLNAIVVSGDTPGGLHAWNKVEIDGNWLNIDATWNDAQTTNGYLLIGDHDPGFADHKENTSFMLDTHIAIYSTKK